MKSYHPQNSFFGKYIYRLRKWLKYERITYIVCAGSHHPKPAAKGTSRNTAVACSILDYSATEPIRTAAYQYSRVRTKTRQTDQISWLQAGNKSSLAIAPVIVSCGFSMNTDLTYWQPRGRLDRTMLATLAGKYLRKSRLKNRGYVILVIPEIDSVLIDKFRCMTDKYNARLRVVIFGPSSCNIEPDYFKGNAHILPACTQKQLNRCFRSLAKEDIDTKTPNKLNVPKKAGLDQRSIGQLLRYLKNSV